MAESNGAPGPPAPGTPDVPVSIQVKLERLAHEAMHMRHAEQNCVNLIDEGRFGSPEFWAEARRVLRIRRSIAEQCHDIVMVLS